MIRYRLVIPLVVSFFMHAGGQPAAAQDVPPGGGNATGTASTVQLPTFGVAVDADGTLSLKSYTEPRGRLPAGRVAAARSRLPAELAKRTSLRKVSLVKLDAAMKKRLDAGLPIDESMRNLAGLVRLRYALILPEEPDIVLAGPADGFGEDAAGRAISLSEGRPALRLEDLAVALRQYPAGSRSRPFVGCTISPTADGLSRLHQFQRGFPRTIRNSQRRQAAIEMAAGVRRSLGHADIRVFGVSQRTHLARVMLEADYRMKRIAIGVERPPIKMATYISALKTPQQGTLQRWWLTPHYDCLRVSHDRRVIELVGQGVRLKSEDKRFGHDGSVASSGGKPSRAMRVYTTAFTKNYPNIAAASPAFAELRNGIDLLVAAAFMQQQDFYGQAGWRPTTLTSETRFAVETLSSPTKVACPVNVVWKGNRLMTPSGGGVSIQADLALQESHWLTDEDQQLVKIRQQITSERNRERWWWD